MDHIKLTDNDHDEILNLGSQIKAIMLIKNKSQCSLKEAKMYYDNLTKNKVTA